MRDFSRKIDDIHYKMGEVHGMMKEWRKNCEGTHSDVGKRIDKVENKFNTFFWFIFVSMCGILIKVLIV